MVGLPLGGCVGGILIIPLGLTPGSCLGVSGLPIGPLRFSFDGLLKTGLVVGFDAVAGTRSGCRFAFAVGHGAIRASAERAGAFWLAARVKLLAVRHFVPAAGPSQATVVPQRAPKAAPAALTLSWHLA